MKKPTPGPWHRDKFGNVVDSNNNPVCFSSVTIRTYGSKHFFEEAEANTNLAVAAPGLYDFVAQLSRFTLSCEVEDHDPIDDSMTLQLLIDNARAIVKAIGIE